MDRNLVFCALALSACGALGWLFGALPARAVSDPSGQKMERRCWRRLWLPLIPSALALALLIGWALQEPGRTDEIVRPLALWTSLPVALVWLRAFWRAWQALRGAERETAAVAVGLWRPRVIISDDFRRAIDERAVAAAEAHEQAHVRHRDPLRVFLAQIATDLQWPARAARDRWQAWATALELARDEEARYAGVRGADLASAIVGAARWRRATAAPRAAAFLTGEENALLRRVHRLLGPLAPPPARARQIWWLAGIALLGLAAGIGIACGDAVVRALPIVRS
ncbi:MAG TPA: hypothetical protein VH374_00220 [Polyangia bacterium]|jgi:Zn-dependent protease with chaperone function|nr:hypothetical protein [Polyangia bacterium]